eukprot:3843245-Amphidinium_carterae.1
MRCRMCREGEIKLVSVRVVVLRIVCSLSQLQNSDHQSFLAHAPVCRSSCQGLPYQLLWPSTIPQSKMCQTSLASRSACDGRMEM